MAARYDFPRSTTITTKEDDPELDLCIMDSNGDLTREEIIKLKGSKCVDYLEYKIPGFASFKDHDILHNSFKTAEQEIRYCLSHEGTNEYRDEDDRTLLHWIKNSTPLPIIKILAEAGVPTDTKDNEGCTPLAIAVDNKNVAAVEYLISLNADVNVNFEDWVASDLPQLACVKQSPEILRLLVEAGADLPAADDRFGGSLLNIALAGTWRSRNLDLVRYLVDELGFDVNGSNGSSKYPIIQAASINPDRASRESEILRFLIRRKVDLNVTDEEGRQAVHIAAQESCSYGLEILVNAGADINVEDHYGRRPIHFAAGLSPECLEYIVGQKVDINVPDHDGWTPLMWAARSGKEWSVRKLTRIGADKWCRGRGYETEWSALKLARFWNWEEADIPALLVPKRFTRKTADGREETWEKDFHKSPPSHRKNSTCTSCRMEIIGLRWKCIDCYHQSFTFCFKCYNHVSTLHDPEHEFENIGPLYDNRPTPLEDDIMDDHEFSGDESVQSIEEVPEIDDDSIVEVEDYDDCDVSVSGNNSIDNDAEWMMLYHERTIKI